MTNGLKVTQAMKQRWAQPGYREHWSELTTGHAVSDETIKKIKTARALQNESKRAAGWLKWLEHNPGAVKNRNWNHETRVRAGKAGSRGDKQQAGRLGAKAGSAKAQHTRWHLNRGQISSLCPFCASSPVCQQ